MHAFGRGRRVNGAWAHNGWVSGCVWVGKCVARVDAGERRAAVMRVGSTGDGEVSRGRTAGISRIWGSAVGSWRRL